MTNLEGIVLKALLINNKLSRTAIKQNQALLTRLGHVDEKLNTVLDHIRSDSTNMKLMGKSLAEYSEQMTDIIHDLTMIREDSIKLNRMLADYEGSGLDGPYEFKFPEC